MNTKKVLILLVCFVLFAQWAFAQEERWVNFTNTNYIRSMAVEDNYVWVGTEGGVIRWDKNTGQYVKYTTADGLAENWITVIAIDSEGNKWFGTYNCGLTKFDGTTWTTYTAADGLIRNEVREAITIDDDDTIWIACLVGYMSKFDGTTWTTCNLPDAGAMRSGALSIVIDSEGIAWFGTQFKGVYKFDGTIWWDNYTTADGLADNRVWAIAIDSENNKWFGTEGGVSKFDGTTWTTYTTEDGLANNHVYSIAVDSDGTKWCGTGDGGVSKFDGKTWTTYQFDTAVRAITIDSDGTKWIGIWGGVIKFDGTTWTMFTTDDELVANEVKAIDIDCEGTKWFGTWGYRRRFEGTKWFGTWGGVSKFDGTTWTSYTTKDGLTHERVSAVAIDTEGNKWFGTGEGSGFEGNGVSKFDGTTWTTYTTDDGLADNSVNAIAIESNGTKWFGCYGGVSSLYDTIWTTYTEDDGLLSNAVHAITIDSEGTKWFGAGGVSKFDGTTWTTYTKEDGLVSNAVHAITIDSEGNKWFGTYGGVSKFDGTTWTNYKTEDGLAYRVVYVITIDADGTKWFGTKGGVSKFDGTTWTTYTTEDGLADNRVYSIAIDAEGNKWFGTDRGVSAFGILSDLPAEEIVYEGNIVIGYKGDIVKTVTIPGDSAVITLNFFDNSSVSFNFTTGDVANHKLYVKQFNSIPDSFPDVPAFDNALYYYDISLGVDSCEAELTFGYEDFLLTSLGIDEDRLAVSFYDSLDSRGFMWHVLPGVIDKDNKTITVTANRFSLYAITGKGEELIRSQTIPQEYRLFQNYPNPFNYGTTIEYDLPKASPVTLTIYNILGQKVRTLVNEMHPDGDFIITWNGTNDYGIQVSSGVYLYMLQAGNFSAVKKMILIR